MYLSGQATTSCRSVSSLVSSERGQARSRRIYIRNFEEYEQMECLAVVMAIGIFYGALCILVEFEILDPDSAERFDS